MGLVLMSQSDLLMSGGQMSGETRKGMARSEYADMPPGSGRRGRKTMEITYREVAWVLTNYRRLNDDQRALLAARHGIGMEPKTLNEIAHETGRSRRQVLDDELLALRTLAAEIEANRTAVESEPAGAVLREVGARRRGSEFRINGRPTSTSSRSARSPSTRARARAGRSTERSARACGRATTPGSARTRSRRGSTTGARR
jgi:hypothetical protein